MKMYQRNGSSSSIQGCGCGCGPYEPECLPEEKSGAQVAGRVLNIDLLVIDLETCERCVPTADQLQAAMRLLEPAALELGITLRYREVVIQTPEEALANALQSSPTIRINGRDIAQEIYESECESCGDLTANQTAIDCREWHYRGHVFPFAPLPFLIEVIMEAMLQIDELPLVVPSPLEKLSENLQEYFDNRKRVKDMPSCCC